MSSLLRLGLSALLCAFAFTRDSPAASPTNAFAGQNAGDQRDVLGIELCWCPPGTFTMGSPRTEAQRRPGEDQIAVTLSRGFWIGKYEVTQGDWRRIAGELPGELTAETPRGDDIPRGKRQLR